MLTLKSPVRHYAWGSPTVIPRLLGVSADGTPCAELWMGAHPGGPCAIADQASTHLDGYLLATAPSSLGAASVDRFGVRLPFLLKLLAVDAPLSLQAHPSSAQAREGFERENLAGVELEASRRIYRDPFHKPEMVLALTAFEAVIGFRPVRRSLELLHELSCPPLAPYLTALEQHGTRAFHEIVTGLLGEVGVDRPALVRAVREACSRRLAEGSEFVAELETVIRLARAYPSDPGVVIALFMEHVRLQPGEALYVPDGTLHAYLGGVGVEIQASSDNTLRGGLTEKHVDVVELLAILDTSDRPPHWVKPEILAAGVQSFRTPVPEFRLDRLAPAGERIVVEVDGPGILFCVEGSLHASDGAQHETLARGRSVFVPASSGALQVSGDGIGFWATTNLAPTNPAAP